MTTRVLPVGHEEWTESLRDLVATTVETNLTVQGNRMNLITGVAASTALTAVTSRLLYLVFKRKDWL